MNEEDLGAGKQKRRMFWNQQHHKKSREVGCTAGSHEEGLCPDAGGEYIRKPILP